MNFEHFTKKQHLTTQQMKTVYALASFANTPKLEFLNIVKELNPDNRELCNGVPPILKFPNKLRNCSELCCSDVTIKYLKSLLDLDEFKKTELWDIIEAFTNNYMTMVPITFNYGNEIFVAFESDEQSSDYSFIKFQNPNHTKELYFQPITSYVRNVFNVWDVH